MAASPADVVELAKVDVGRVAGRLKACSELGFKTGGGHPYAAGAQCSNFEVSTEAICEEVIRICTPDALPGLLEDEESSN